MSQIDVTKFNLYAALGASGAAVTKLNLYAVLTPGSGPPPSVQAHVWAQRIRR